MPKVNNIFSLPQQLPSQSEVELLEKLAGDSSLLIERIISTGQTTPENKWYDQELDEWVVLLQGEARLLFANNEAITLKSGDYLLIPARKKHRVVFTSSEPPCIWLAIHGAING